MGAPEMMIVREDETFSADDKFESQRIDILTTDHFILQALHESPEQTFGYRRPFDLIFRSHELVGLFHHPFQRLAIL